MDDWETFDTNQLPAGFSIEWLFAQHNEHRLATTKLLIWIQYQLNGWDLRVHQLLNFALYGFVLLWIVWSMETTRRVALGVIVCFTVFLLSPITWFNHFMGYQSNVHLWLLFFLVSLHCLFSRSQTWNHVVTGCVASVLSIYSASAGFVSSLIVLILFCGFKSLRIFSFNQRARLREWFQLISVVALVGSGLAIWTVGYFQPPGHPPLSFPHTWPFWDHFLNVLSLGFGIDQVSAVLGLLCLFIVLTPILGQVVRVRKNLSSEQWVGFVAVMGILAVLASISTGRGGFGVEQAKSSRYAEFGMVLIPLSMLNWSIFLYHTKKLKGFVLAVLWFFCFLTFWDNWGDFRNYEREAGRRKQGIECIRAYYQGGGEALCPTIFPYSLPRFLAQAKRLDVSFYRNLNLTGQ
jgi:hypothetical protein